MGRKRSKIDPAEVARALMGSLARHEQPQTGWTCKNKAELGNDLQMPNWYEIEFCSEEIRKACEKNKACDEFDWSKNAAEHFGRCRKVEYRQVRTVTEI